MWAHEEDLDVGFGLALQRLAWQGRSEMEATRWLLGKDVQELLGDVAEHLFYTSIEVERRHAEVNNWNPARKLAHIATVSRNAIILRFARWRAAKTQALERAAEEVRKAKRTHWSALAWKGAASEAERPVGARFTVAIDDASPEAAHAQVLDDGGRNRPVATPAAISQLRQRSNDDLVAAQGRYDAILATCHVPATRQQWLQWVRDHNDEFQAARKVATPRRRQFNFRVRARPGLPIPVPRMQPKLAQPACKAVTWQLNLQGRCGWFGLRTSARKVFVFLTTLRGRSYCAVLSSVRSDIVGPTGADLSQFFDLPQRLQPLSGLAQDLGDDVVLETLEFKVVARPSDCWAECGRESGEGVYVEPGAFNRILAPLPVPKRRKAEVETGEEENDDDLESDGDLKCASDLSDPGGVLDTDVESAGEAFESGSEPDDKASVPHAADGASPASDARGAEDEVLAKPSAKTARPLLWDNGYFYIT